jgi:plasmid maintenance system killer protein
MGTWKVDDSEQRIAYEKGKRAEVPASAMRTYHEWKTRIINLDQHPKAAADGGGDMNYEQLGGKLKGEYTIRLSKEHRVAFAIDAEAKVVRVFLIGGHYPPD